MLLLFYGGACRDPPPMSLIRSHAPKPRRALRLRRGLASECGGLPGLQRHWLRWVSSLGSRVLDKPGCVSGLVLLCDLLDGALGYGLEPPLGSAFRISLAACFNGLPVGFCSDSICLTQAYRQRSTAAGLRRRSLQLMARATCHSSHSVQPCKS